jgi:putative ABC transport system substrate-binding protein
MFNPNSAPNATSFARSVEVAAPQFSVQAATMHVNGPAEIEAAIAKFEGEPQGGLILPPDTHTASQCKLIVDLAVRYRLPAIYALKQFAAEDGLAKLLT